MIERSSRRSSWALSIGFCASITGCAGPAPTTKLPDPVDPEVFEVAKTELLSGLKDTSEAASRARDQLTLVSTTLTRLVDPSRADARAAFNSYKSAVEGFGTQATAFSTSAGSVDSLGKKLYSFWERNDASLSNEDVRESAEERRTESLETFEGAQESLSEAVKAMTGLQKETGDVVKLLELDLSAEGIQDVSRVARQINSRAADASELVDTALEGIQKVIADLPK